MTGYAKIILTATTTIIVAAYSVSLKDVQNRAVQTAVQKVQTVQAEHVQNAVLSLAVNHIADYGTTAFSDKFVICGVNTSYAIQRIDTTSARVTITTTNGDTQKMFARVDNYSQGNYKVHRNGWRVTDKFI
jgi:hypothetical protein